MINDVNPSLGSPLEDAPFHSIDARTGLPFGDAHPVSTIVDVARACAAADAAFDEYRSIPRETRAVFLERIATEILVTGDTLIVAAARESGLPSTRLEGERFRTVAQLRLFADVVRRGADRGLRHDPALPERKPLPRPDLRVRMIALGPVAVFGASNFPLAFSTAGGDTASALAAGCPVVVKGHPAHPRTGALVASAILRAVAACGMPDGTFAHLTGPSHDLGAALVCDPRIAAAGFTGSRAGGLALLALAQARPVPIPVYAEMASINPVVLCPAALAARSAEIADAFVQSLSNGAGQFCTNPGLILMVEGAGCDMFVAAAREALGGVAAQTMLTREIRTAYDAGVGALLAHPQVTLVGRGRAGEGVNGAGAALFETSAEAFLGDQRLGAEIFGAVSLLVRCANVDSLRQVLRALEGQLTATLHMDDADAPLATALLPLLERKAGRILMNGWPTGVEVADAMVHGGPYPATSDVRSTSVGTLAIDRFLRPICYQGFALDPIIADFA